MMHESTKDGAWFAPKRFGYGAGVPIAWQGWALLLLYVASVAGIALLNRAGTTGARMAALALFLLVTGLFVVIAAKRTRGGWKWRSGKRD
ncbi:hypothetical protein ACLIMP_06495 [Novosphingobium aerophilum]|uniref:hypothetical protein n=1 Tax=Novosphingobium TaxID=165696 RepID=UPI002D76F4E7|nr:hypothetical protein [Novosphingobium sp. RL4]WRT93871.1 hypothetical protein U9J33_04975 [Novosphingobium sp. RL4]